MEQILDSNENRQNKTTRYRTILALGLLSALVSLAAYTFLTVYLGPFFVLLVMDMHREYVHAWQSSHWLVIAWKCAVCCVFLAPIIVMHFYRIKQRQINYFKLVVPALVINCLSLVMVVVLFKYYILVDSPFSYIEILSKGGEMGQAMINPFTIAIILNLALPYFLQKIGLVYKKVPTRI